MKKTSYFLASTALAIVAAFLVGRCTADGPNPQSQPTAGVREAAAAELWTCSMHPQIRLPEPGACPICGMDLIPIDLGGSLTDEGSGSVLTLSEAARARAAIETSPVTRAFPVREVRLSGRVEMDETRVRTLTARFPARLDRLYLDYTGVPVRRGDHLAQVYSPELLTAQSELLSSIRFAEGDRLLSNAARRKMTLWGFSDQQIDAIVERGTATDRLEIDAPVEGIVVEKNVSEGDYVETGTRLFRIADLSVVWVMFDAYESDLPWLRYGQRVSFRTESDPGKNHQGEIVFIEPVLDRETRTVRVRVNVANPHLRLKPGMFVQGTVQARIAGAGQVMAADHLTGKWICPMHPEVIEDDAGSCGVCGMDLVRARDLGYVTADAETAPLLVPVSAVLRTGRRAIAYVERSSVHGVAYEGRQVELGPRAGDVFIVLQGLGEGERVVTQGAFRIDSSLQIRGEISMMHEGEREDEREPPIGSGSGSSESRAISPGLLDAYLAVATALTADNGTSAHEAALDLERVLDGARKRIGPELTDPLIEEMYALATGLAAASGLEDLRVSFRQVSDGLRVWLRAVPPVAGRDLYQVHCPMAFENRGADWYQSHTEVRNPYFGESMLYCGEVVMQVPGSSDEPRKGDHHE